MAKKKRTSFSLSEDILILLAAMAEKENRSQANMLEVLVKEKAAALNITAPKPD
jgi:hypothetical protein